MKINTLNIKVGDTVQLISWEELRNICPVEDLVKPLKQHIGVPLKVLEISIKRDLRYYTLANNYKHVTIEKQVIDPYIAKVNNAIPEKIVIEIDEQVASSQTESSEVECSETTEKHECQCNCTNAHALDSMHIESIVSPHILTKKDMAKTFHVVINANVTKAQYVALLELLSM